METKRWFNAATVLLSTLLILFIVSLVYLNFRSNAKVRRILIQQLTYELERQAAGLAYFYSERRDDLRDLTAGRSLNNLFINRALGMTLEYGLKGSLLDLHKTLVQFKARKKLGRDSIYSRIAFVSRGGDVVVDSTAKMPLDLLDEFDESDQTKMQLSWLQNAQNTEIDMTPDPDNPEALIVSARYAFKGVYEGRILAWVSQNTVYRNLVRVTTQTSRRQVFLVSERHNWYLPTDQATAVAADEPLAFLKSTPGLKNGKSPTSVINADTLAIRARVNNTMFSLLIQIPMREVVGFIPAWHLPVAIGVVSFFILVAMFFVLRTNVSNQVLSARLDETAKRRQDLEKANNTLSATQATLQEQESRYRTLTANLPGIVFRQDLAGEKKATFFNRMLFPLTGFQPDELPPGRRCVLEALINENQKAGVAATVAESVSRKTSYELEYGITTRDGESRFLIEKAKTVVADDGTAKFIDGVILDVTQREIAEREQKEMAVRLMNAQKMESIGTLTGGIAHDFNNILSIILGNTELAMDDVGLEGSTRVSLEEVRSACLRAKDVIRQLLSYSRKSGGNRKPLYINVVVTDFISLARATIPASIEIRHQIADDLYTVSADPAQIHQVLLNLFSNSADAMEDECGVLEIKLDNTTLYDPVSVEYADLLPGKYACITISDTGPGIPEENLDRIFDPYFTTKEVGKGTGMGLAVVHGAIQNHGGAIAVDSSTTGGTTFRILLPAIEDPRPAAGPGQQELPGGDEKILFIDDEEAIVTLGKRRLTRLGYQVETEQNPLYAIERVRNQPQAYDLVITDMTMPRMNGDQVVRQLREINPDLPVILCTGFSTKIDAAKAAALGINRYIEKPLNKYELAQAIRAVLDMKR